MQAGGGLVGVDVSGGAAKLAALGKQLKGPAGKELRKELRIGLNRATKPLKEDVKKGIPLYMPSGYGPVLQKAFRARTEVRQSQNARVTITATAKGRRRNRDVRALNKGILRHPVFDNRDHWVMQKIKRGFWSERLAAGAPKVRAEVQAVIARVNDKIIRG